jgi:hypothetical protein
MVVSCSLFLDQAAGGFPACIALILIGLEGGGKDV